jgi:hypothetical protein
MYKADIQIHHPTDREDESHQYHLTRINSFGISKYAHVISTEDKRSGGIRAF